VNTNDVVGTHDIALIVLDALRYDVAAEELAEGRTPNLAARIGSWEKRHSPGTFTYASHQAFFAGFLPTPAKPGRHARRFALAFEGSETTGPTTCVLDGAASIPEGLAARGYHTLCVGGTGFFNLRNPLGNVLPGLFAERHWDRSTGVTDKHAFENQIAIVERSLAALPAERRAFTFVNVPALHQPNHFYLEGGPERDTVASHAAALRYIDEHVPRLFAALRRPTFVIVTSDHGTLYGEDGFYGHRIAHPLVTTVPYAEVLL
jgi:arylsulfatase A-like enzyme